MVDQRLLADASATRSIQGLIDDSRIHRITMNRGRFKPLWRQAQRRIAFKLLATNLSRVERKLWSRYKIGTVYVE